MVTASGLPLLSLPVGVLRGGLSEASLCRPHSGSYTVPPAHCAWVWCGNAGQWLDGAAQYMVSCFRTVADVPTVTPLNLGFCTLVAQLGLPLLHPVDGSSAQPPRKVQVGTSSSSTFLTQQLGSPGTFSFFF